MKFKRIINVLLVLFLLASNMGLSFNVHYCDDEIASVTLNTAANSYEIEEDCCGVVEKSSKCCDNKIIKSLEKFDQITVKSFTVDSFYNSPENKWKLDNFPNPIQFQSKRTTSYYCDANAPPLFLLYSQYTFYS